MSSTTGSGTDRGLLLEVGLGLILFVLGVVLFFQPAAEGPLSPRWWHWLVLGVLFFALVGVHTFRRKQRRHRGLHEAIREEGGP